MSTPRLFLVATVISATTMITGCGGSDRQRLERRRAQPPGRAAPDTATTNSSTASSASNASAANGDITNVDACCLLTTDEVSPLVAQPTSKPLDSGNPGDKACRWEGGDQSNGPPPDLVLVINDSLKQAPADQVKQALQSEASDGGKVVDGLGDFGIVRSTNPGTASVVAIRGPFLITMDLDAAGADFRRDAVAALAKTAVGRLG